MPRDQQLKDALRHWFSKQKKYKSIRAFAKDVGLPFNTLRGYFYGKRPSDQNLKLITNVTGITVGWPVRTLPRLSAKKVVYASRLLDELQYDLARCIASIPPVQATLGDGRSGGRATLRSARQIQSLMDALQRCLEPIVNKPEALALVRKVVSGSDAGYLSGLLGSLFDDRRLQTWREMTTYVYGSK